MTDRPIWKLFVAMAAFFAVAGSLRADILYVTTGNGTGLATIDPSTGAGTVIGPSGASGTYAAAYDPTSDTLYGIHSWATSANSLATWNTGTGAATVVAGTFGNDFMLAMEVADDGTIYTGSWDGNLYSINPGTGAPTLIGSMGFGSVMDFAFDSSGTLYAIDSGGTGNDLYTVDLGTGAGTLASSIVGADGYIMGIMFDSTDKLYATTYIANSSFYEINPGTGASTFIGSTGLYYAHGGDFTSAVPEPASLALVGLGAMGMIFGAIRRRRQRAA